MISIAKPIITEDEKNAVLEVLSKGQLASGEYVSTFENAFKSYLGAQHALCTSSGTTALHAALLAAGIGEGDLVITSPFSFIATANSILYTGAKPLFADVEEETYNINPDKIEKLIVDTPTHIKAMVVVHLFGNSCDMNRIMEICKKHHIILIEDCAQAHGAEFKGKKVGTFGDVSAFSFYPTKNITCGEGGMLVTNNEELYNKAKKIVNHGQTQRYVHDMLGYNFRMTNLEAALGIAQLKKIDAFNDSRISNAKQYLQRLSHDKYILPSVNTYSTHVFNQFTIRCKNSRTNVIDALENNNIGYGIYYPSLIPEQPFYNKITPSYSCPIAKALCNDVLSIPVHPSLSKADINTVIEVLNA